jgi:hypothetical protein
MQLALTVTAVSDSSMRTSRRVSQPSPSASIQCTNSERSYPSRCSGVVGSLARSSASVTEPAGGEGDDVGLAVTTGAAVGGSIVGLTVRLGPGPAAVDCADPVGVAERVGDVVREGEAVVAP